MWVEVHQTKSFSMMASVFIASYNIIELKNGLVSLKLIQGILYSSTDFLFESLHNNIYLDCDVKTFHKIPI